MPSRAEVVTMECRETKHVVTKWSRVTSQAHEALFTSTVNWARALYLSLQESSLMNCPSACQAKIYIYHTRHGNRETPLSSKQPTLTNPPKSIRSTAANAIAEPMFPTQFNSCRSLQDVDVTEGDWHVDVQAGGGGAGLVTAAVVDTANLLAAGRCEQAGKETGERDESVTGTAGELTGGAGVVVVAAVVVALGGVLGLIVLGLVVLRLLGVKRKVGGGVLRVDWKTRGTGEVWETRGAWEVGETALGERRDTDARAAGRVNWELVGQSLGADEAEEDGWHEETHFGDWV
ncbi:hypothetical protein EJ05DRAFT_535376 [Pseudovirgaria hyperparasitica]|uniref:Uncharacterized protein n=1 Tax=Pseudovirgaria hyperparasitica TaxID=470096 RepID=A0A6A6WH20_9PEZI|nr:uncharacterized protein EJ05DRAFT_535376 [Pseudovirgaria hyperparasitica]KAF2762098.1 hypothetical protein EJ05DRAFT_535376 [Pseudovirgaria hyperparasitica]